MRYVCFQQLCCATAQLSAITVSRSAHACWLLHALSLTRTLCLVMFSVQLGLVMISVQLNSAWMLCK